MEQRPAISTTVLIIGAGPSGLATAACLASRHIPVLVLERDNTASPLWHHRTYARLHLHLPKQFCELPLLPYPPSFPNYLPCSHFLRYLEDYVQAFGLGPLLRLRRRVDSAEFNAAEGRWRVAAANLGAGEVEEYEARFVVVATGENDEPVLPGNIPGLDRFDGNAVHSSRFRSGKEYEGLDVLVVGSGNSGMEIACDLADSGARTKIVVRSQVMPSWWERSSSMKNQQPKETDIWALIDQHDLEGLTTLEERLSWHKEMLTGRDSCGRYFNRSPLLEVRLPEPSLIADPMHWITTEKLHFAEYQTVDRIVTTTSSGYHEILQLAVDIIEHVGGSSLLSHRMLNDRRIHWTHPSRFGVIPDIPMSYVC